MLFDRLTNWICLIQFIDIFEIRCTFSIHFIVKLSYIFVLPKAFDVDGIVAVRREHGVVRSDLVNRRHFFLDRLAFDQVDVPVLQ